MEALAMISANLFGGLVCLILGLILRTGKANFLMAGYNTMSKEEQARWDAKAMSGFIGWLLIIPSAVLLLGCIPVWFNFYPQVFLLVTWCVFIAVILAGVFYMNLSSRFKRG